MPSEVCQVGWVRVSELTCDRHESGGYSCEVIGEHTRHQVGAHTIKHALAGNGYSCEFIEESG